MFSSTFKTPASNRTINNDFNNNLNSNNSEFTKPLINNTNKSNIQENYSGDKSSRNSNRFDCSVDVLNDKFNKYNNTLSELNSQKPKQSNLKAKIYNFLERPTGW